MINLERNGVLGTYPKDNLMLLLQISVGLYNVDALEEGLSGNEP